MLEDKEVLKLAAYVGLSGYRTRALQVLNNHPVMTPKYIAIHCDVRPNHISVTLRELKERKLVVCINEDAKKGRLYKITSLGRKVIETVPVLEGKSIGELNDL